MMPGTMLSSLGVKRNSYNFRDSKNRKKQTGPDFYTRTSRKITVWLNTMYLHVTLTKISVAFFLFSFAHCFIHGIIQSLLYSLDANADSLVSGITTAAQVPGDDLAWLTRHKGSFNLQLCKDDPFAPNASCVTIFETGNQSIDVPSGFRRDVEASNATSLEVGPVTRVSSSGFGEVSADIQALFGPQNVPESVELLSESINNGEIVNLNLQCTRVLVYADQVLRNSKREELALLASEFWLLGISVFALMYDSIPHLLAGLSMRALSTGWSAYAIWRTHDIQERFNVLIANGPCGIDIFPSYFKTRIVFQIPDLISNLLALLVSFFLVYRLSKAFALYSFSRVGAPEHLTGLYRVFLGVFVCLQLSVYLLTASVALWIDQLLNEPIAHMSFHTTIYIGLFLFTMIVLVPWITMGWFAVRRELRRTMFAYLSFGFIFFSCWTIMYYSRIFRWTWFQWPFFACLNVTSQLVLIASIILGVVCWKNFGKGLAHYFFVNSLLEASDFEPEVFSHKADADIENQLEKDNVFKIDLKLTVPSLAKTASWK